MLASCVTLGQLSASLLQFLQLALGRVKVVMSIGNDNRHIISTIVTTFYHFIDQELKIRETQDWDQGIPRLELQNIREKIHGTISPELLETL